MEEFDKVSPFVLDKEITRRFIHLGGDLVSYLQQVGLINIMIMRNIALSMMYNAFRVANVRCDCSDPRDAVYALLAVLPYGIEPDDQKSVKKVYLGWARQTT